MKFSSISEGRTWRAGLLWAILMILLVYYFPTNGGWTIDDGVKRIAAEQGEGMWAEMIHDGPVREDLGDPARHAPLHPPFVYRVPDGFAFGFSAGTRAFFKSFAHHERIQRLVIAAAAILLWIVMEHSGLTLAFLLLPLTFYGLVPWEHGLSWLLIWPITWLALTRPQGKAIKFAASGVLAALSVLLRFETILLVGVLTVHLIVKRRRRSALAFAVSSALVIGVVSIVHVLTAEQPMWVQLSLNSHASAGAASWLWTRVTTLYGLLLMMDRDLRISGGLIVLFGGGLSVLILSERRSNRFLLACAVVLFGAWAVAFQYRIWSYPVPPIALLGANSLLATLPWIAVLFRPPYRDRSAFVLAVVTSVLVILIAPTWEGVHWGPRLLLFVVPLLAIDLYLSKRARGWAFTVLLLLTVVQTISSATLAYARDKELSQHNQLVESKLGPIVICTTSSQCADLSPLWTGREFFTASAPRQFKQLLIELRREKQDTCWLHLEAHDPLYSAAFPDNEPVRPRTMTILQCGSLYRTQWRVFQLLMNRSDSAWTGILQAEAGTLLRDSLPESALKIQLEAAELSPLSAQAHHNLALIYASLGQIQEARVEVQRALDIDPAFKEAHLLEEDLSRRSGDNPAAPALSADSARALTPD